MTAMTAAELVVVRARLKRAESVLIRHSRDVQDDTAAVLRALGIVQACQEALVDVGRSAQSREIAIDRLDKGMLALHCVAGTSAVPAMQHIEQAILALKPPLLL